MLTNMRYCDWEVGRVLRAEDEYVGEQFDREAMDGMGVVLHQATSTESSLVMISLTSKLARTADGFGSCWW